MEASGQLIDQTTEPQLSIKLDNCWLTALVRTFRYREKACAPDGDQTTIPCCSVEIPIDQSRLSHNTTTTTTTTTITTTTNNNNNNIKPKNSGSSFQTVAHLQYRLG